MSDGFTMTTGQGMGAPEDPFAGAGQGEVQGSTQGSAQDTALTEEEKKMAAEYARQIDLYDSGAVLQYGAGVQKKMADFSEKALENVRTKDLGEIGDLLSGVVTELRDFDEEETKGFFGFFKKSANKVTALKARYEKAEANISRICETLEGYQRQLLKDAAILDKMYGQNLEYFRELSIYIAAGKKKLEDTRNVQLPALVQKANATGLPGDI